ncbi:MAG: DUF4157 domain-containing protein [Roseateles asaccharophilus]|uniref:eCIS core domain-containing protein n=1 Tax=Roseateles asaccharophilus TaxID=582607 RepID=UPI00391D91FA
MSTEARQLQAAESPGPQRTPAAVADNAVALSAGATLPAWSDSPRQLKQAEQLTQLQPATAPASHGGLPENLRSGIEALSGLDMSGVRVHRNSSKPAALQAHAFAQGQDIHLGPGQDKHLPHEAWHVVQQAQGRVRPTMLMKSGLPVNDDGGLEHEADVMGTRAARWSPSGNAQGSAPPPQCKSIQAGSGTVQRNLNTYALAGTSSGAFGNIFGTSTFEDLRSRLQAYQASADNAEKLGLLKEMQALGKKWLSDNQKKTAGSIETKRASIRALLGLVQQELAARDNTAVYFKEAKDFEHRLGLYLFNFPAATTAARQALDQMSTVMGVTADNSKAPDVFGGDDVKYAGNVGKDVTRVMEVINRGNLRERMTAFYNASLGSFKNMVQEHISLTGAVAGQSWDQAKLALAGKGIGATGVAEIEQRRNEIADYPNKTGYSIAKILGKDAQLKDVYKAAGDRFTRAPDDALLRGQKGVFESEGRDDAFKLGAYAMEAFNFNFDALDFTSASLLGTATGKVRKTYFSIREALDDFHGTTSSTQKLARYNELWSLSNTWIKDNTDKTDANSQLKRQSLQGLQASLRKVYSGSTRTPADLVSGGLNAGLSPREQEFIMSKSPAHNTPDLSEGADIARIFGEDRQVYDSTKQLPWEEGGSRFNASVRNAWVNEAVNVLKMPVVAGPSGTTDRMLQALKYLGAWNNPVDPDAFRLSLLGWMLSSNDHSFHEIMAVSQSFGLDYSPGPYAYHRIPPLTIQQIRANVCLNRNFPDEIVHMRLWPNFELVKNELASGNDSMTAHARQSANIQSRLSPVAAAAINLYTGGSYLVQNPVMEGGALTGPKVKKAVDTNKHGQLTGLKAEVDAGNVSVDDLKGEAAQHNIILANALKDLPNFAGRTYRGQADFLRANYTMGDRHTFSKFTSTSRSKAQAVSFMERSKFKAPVFVQLDVQTGRNIEDLSRYPAEREVLLQPGTSFSVTNVEPGINDNSDNVPADKRPYTRVTMQEA